MAEGQRCFSGPRLIRAEEKRIVRTKGQAQVAAAAAAQRQGVPTSLPGGGAAEGSFRT